MIQQTGQPRGGIMLSKTLTYFAAVVLLAQSMIFADTVRAAEAGRIMEISDRPLTEKQKAQDEAARKKREEIKKANEAKRAEMKARDKKNMQDLKDKVDAHVKKGKPTENSKK
jgi:hypothetical protein